MESLKHHLRIEELYREKGKKEDHFMKAHVVESKSGNKKPLKKSGLS